MLCWKPSRMFFFEFAKVNFYFAKVSRKLGIIIIICKGLPPTAARGPEGEGHQRMRVAVAKFPKVRLCESQTPRPLVFAFPSVRPLPPADGRGLWIGIFSRKFRESYAKERAKVKVHVEGGGPVNFAKKTVLRRDSVMLAACLKGYQEVIRDSLA